MQTLENFIAGVQAWQAARNLNNKALAEAIGVHPTIISDFYAGKRLPEKVLEFFNREVVEARFIVPAGTEEVLNADLTSAWEPSPE